MTDETAERNPSRRIFLAAGSSAAVFGALHAAVAAEADPIFAAIERHKRARSAFAAACNLTDSVLAKRQGRVVTAADEAAYAVADDEELDAIKALVATAPTTKPGMREALAYLTKCESAYDGSLDDFVETLIASPVLA